MFRSSLIAAALLFILLAPALADEPGIFVQQPDSHQHYDVGALFIAGSGDGHVLVCDGADRDGRRAGADALGKSFGQGLLRQKLDIPDEVLATCSA